MRDFLNKNKGLFGGVLGLGLLVWVYFTFFAGGGEPLLSEAPATSPVSQELLITLGNLRTINLDETIFADPVFVSLSDFGVTIPPEAVGRRNPFAPVAGGAGGTTSIEAPPGAR